LFPLWPFDSLPEQGEMLSEKDDDPEAEKKAAYSLRQPSARPPVSAVPPIGPPPTPSRASVARVLDWATREIVPRGMSRSAAGDYPAGIELYGVAPLGIGLIDGDRLVTVDGISVTAREQVVGAVLGARARRAETMIAGLVRRTKDGPVPFTVVVEQPYPEHVPDLPAQETLEETHGETQEGEEQVRAEQAPPR
jgi:hypothetical protein